MVNSEEIIKRLKEYKKYKKSVQLADYLGVSANAISLWSLNKRDIDLKLILEKFPELNPSWIILGVGPKYLFEASNQNEENHHLKDELKKNDTEISEITEDCNSLDNEIRIRQLEAQVSILKDIVFQKMK